MKINEAPAAEQARLRGMTKPVTDRFLTQYDPVLVKLYSSELQRTQTQR
jgi:hypothetical protein